MSNRPSGPEPSAELRLALLIARRGEVLLGRPGGDDRDDVAWTLPSGKLAVGESFVLAARRIADESLGVPLTLVTFQRLTLAAESPGAVASVTLGLYAEVEPTTEASQATWLFFPTDDLPQRLSLDAEAALRAFVDAAPIVDLDGAALAVGYGPQLAATLPAPTPPPEPAQLPHPAPSLASLLSEPEATPDFKTQPISQWSALLKSALLLGGGWGWLTGVGVALDEMHVFRTQGYDSHQKLQVAVNGAAALLILVLGLRHGFRLCAASTRWRGVFRALGSIVFGCMFLIGLVLLATLNPRKNDGMHMAFWIWFLSLLTTALSLYLLRPRSAPQPRSVFGKLVWLGLTFASLVSVFPPLKDALFPRSDSDHTADAPPPSDD